MSYLKIMNPAKRMQEVQEYLASRNRLKERFARERVQRLNASQAREEYFGPVIQSQAKTTDAVEVLNKNQQQTLEAIANQSQILAALPEIGGPQADSTILEDMTEYYDAKDVTLDKTMQDALGGLEYGAYNVKWLHNRHVIGSKSIKFGDGKVRFNKRDYPATEGLLQLLTRKDPKGYDEEDLDNYSDILDKSDAIYQGGNQPVDKNSIKWRNIVRPIWERLFPDRAKKADSRRGMRYPKTGTGVMFLPSDPNALVKRLQLLIASARAGNTGMVKNEAIAILDELLRINSIDRKEYKSILSTL